MHIEEFLELEAHLCLLHLLVGVRIMDESEGGVSGDEVQATHDEVGEGFGKGRQQAHQGLGQLLDGARAETILLHLLGGVVIRLHTHLGDWEVAGIVHLWMRELVATAIDGWFAEDDVLRAHLVGLEDILRGAKPYQIDHTEAIREVSHQSLVALAGVKLLVAQYLTLDLHKRHIGGQLADMEYLAPIYIFIRIVFQQVTIRVDTKFLAQYLLLLGTYTG